jgi:anti-sigma B factor antagonist
MKANGPMAIRVRTDGSTAIVEVEGELDLASAPRLRHTCAEVLRERPEQIVLDLGGTTFCDSTGVNAIMFVRVEGEAVGVPVVLGTLSRAASRVLEIAGLLEYFRVRDRQGDSPTTC